MIDLVWNFPLFPGQGAEWQGYLRRAVDGLHVEDARELRPSFRGADAELRVRSQHRGHAPIQIPPQSHLL